MPYCTQCGKALQENEICSCQATAQPVETPRFEQPQAAPQQQYAAPQQPYSAPQQHAAPQQPYGAPQQPYGAPQQQYAAPQQPYGAPQQQYAAPQQPYGAPQQPYGAPQQPYGAPQQPYYGAPYGAPVKPANTFFNDLLNVIVTFFKKPAEAKTLAIKNGNLLIPGVLLGVYAFFTMIVTWLSFNSITLSTWRTVKEAYGDYLSESGMKYGKITKEIFNVPGLLFAGLLTAVVFVGILLLIRFTMSKIAGSNEGDLKSGLVVVSLYSIPATALVFLACICSFFSLGLCLILSALASLFMLVSVLTDTARINATQLESGKWLFIFPAVVIIALVLNALLGSLFIKIGLSEQVREVIDGMGKLITDPSSVFEGIM
ncbi:MAG: hypothetical protein IJC94_09210 [Oscillospiraceae bacterium]|nr:hypothetical protein [Oscillospiraceae bacterium]